MVTHTEFKILRVNDEIRTYKFLYNEETDVLNISYYVMSRYDMTRLTDIGIFMKILPYNGLVVREIAKQWFNYTT